MIEKIIHQYWDGILPSKYKEFSKQFQLLNPDFNYFLWNKELVLSKCKNHILYSHLKATNHPITSSDIARVIILDMFGGIYFDSDMRPERSIPEYLLYNPAFACYENEKNLGQTIANGAIGSEKSGIYINNLIKEIIKISPTDIKQINLSNCWLILGPRLWTKVFFDSLSDQCIMIYPSWYFIPNHYIVKGKEKTGYITTHIWQDRYYKNKSIKYITHYGHNRKVKIIHTHQELVALQKTHQI